MQLNVKSGVPVAGAVRAGLAAATCGLLSLAPTPATGMQVDGATLVYSEPNRVSAVETVIQATRESDGGGSLGLKLVIDALTGASANGATPSLQIQTFTRPSGKSSYTVPAGQTPLDPSFRDTRYAASGSLTRPIGRFSQWNTGLNISAESDYLSLGISGGISHDLALRNTTLFAGFSLSRDTVRPHGGAPDPLTPMAGSGAREDDDSLAWSSQEEDE